MNIFKILSNGEGRIKEPNISAFLGYLLDPAEDHGLGFLFIEEFISKISPDFKIKKYNYEILYEQGFKDLKKDKIDIVILCKERGRKQGENNWENSFEMENSEVKKIFLLENKIQDRSTTKGQLESQYKSVVKNVERWNLTQEDIYMIYVTPEGSESRQEFESADIENDHKFHIFWKSEKDVLTILQLLQELIQKDELAQIDPIHQEVKQSIKAFFQFVKTDFKSREQEKKERRNDGEYTKNKHKKMEDNKVFEKLSNCKSYLEQQNPKIKFDKELNTKDSQLYRFSLDLKDITISVGSSPSGKNIVIYLDKKDEIEEVSKKIIKEFSRKYNSEIRGNGNLQVVKGTDKILISDIEKINQKLHEILEFYSEVLVKLQ